MLVWWKSLPVFCFFSVDKDSHIVMLWLLDIAANLLRVL